MGNQMVMTSHDPERWNS